MPAGNPSEWSHEEVLVWLDKKVRCSKKQKQRLINALKEDGVEGSGLQWVAKSDIDKAHRTLTKWPVDDEDDRAGHCKVTINLSRRVRSLSLRSA